MEIPVFSDLGDIFNGLSVDDPERFLEGCKRFKQTLRNLFQEESTSVDLVQEYLRRNPDLMLILKGFEWSNFKAIFCITMDIVGLLLASKKISFNRKELIVRLLLHKEQILNYLKENCVVSIVRTFTHAIRNGFLQDLINAEVVFPVFDIDLNFRKRKPDVEPKRSIQSFLISFFASIVVHGSSVIRCRMLDQKLNQVLKNLDQEQLNVQGELLDGFTSIVEDEMVSRSLKVQFFNCVMLDRLRRLYSGARDKVHLLLMKLCTVPGKGVCFFDHGLYSQQPSNIILSFFVLKLDPMDELQLQLLQTILSTSLDIAPEYFSKVNMSVEPRSSSRWISNVMFIVKFLQESKVEFFNNFYPVDPPKIEKIMFFIAPSRHLNKHNFTRGLQFMAPTVLFFTARLLLALLEKSKVVLNSLDEVILHHHGKVRQKWIIFKQTLLTTISNQVCDFNVIQTTILSNLESFQQEQFDEKRFINPKLEKSQDVSPKMVYTLLLRLLTEYIQVLPEKAILFETSILLNPLPHSSLVPDLLKLLSIMPPKLTPKSLSSLLLLHSSKMFETEDLLLRMLRSCSLFANNPKECIMWIREFPNDKETIVFFTNLFGEAITNLNELMESVADLECNFSLLSVALMKREIPKYFELCLYRIKCIQVNLEFEKMLQKFGKKVEVECMDPLVLSYKYLQQQNYKELVAVFEPNLDLFDHPNMKLGVENYPLEILHCLKFAEKDIWQMFIPIYLSYLKTNEHCIGLAFLLEKTSKKLTLNLELTVDQWMILAPFVTVPQHVFDALFQSKISLVALKSMHQIILYNFPIGLESKIQQKLETIPKSFFKQVLKMEQSSESLQIIYALAKHKECFLKSLQKFILRHEDLDLLNIFSNISINPKVAVRYQHLVDEEISTNTLKLLLLVAKPKFEKLTKLTLIQVEQGYLKAKANQNLKQFWKQIYKNIKTLEQDSAQFLLTIEKDLYVGKKPKKLVEKLMEMKSMASAKLLECYAKLIPNILNLVHDLLRIDSNELVFKLFKVFSHCLKQEYLEKLMEMYEGTLSPKDAILFDVFYIYESQGTKLGDFVCGWNSKNFSSVSSAIERIDKSKMLWTSKFFPRDLEFMESAFEEQVQEYLCLDYNVPYDVRFFLMLAQTETNVELLLSRNIIHLAINSLCSNDEKIRSLGICILDKFSVNLQSSFYEGKSSVSLVLHHLNQIYDGSKLPGIFTLFLSQCLWVFQKPFHSLFQPLNNYLINQKVLDLNFVPCFPSFLLSSHDKQSWILQIISCGLYSKEDAEIVRKSHVLEQVITLAESCVPGSKQFRKFIMNILLLSKFPWSEEFLYKHSTFSFLSRCVFESNDELFLKSLFRALMLCFNNTHNDLQRQIILDLFNSIELKMGKLDFFEFEQYFYKINRFSQARRNAIEIK